MVKIIICKSCNELKPHEAKGFCKSCYRKQNKKIIICSSCKELKINVGKNLCQKCFSKQRNIKIITCKNCGEEKPHQAKGLCNKCYSKQFPNKNLVICKECGELKIHHAKGLCNKCYNINLKIKTGKNQPMYLNKSCSQYLGVHIAEQVLSKVFKDVTQMPPNNKSYDFICSKGMKIDVKSSVLLFRKNLPNYKGYWSFTIKRNTIPDYFLCIAFDSRSSLTPQHLWLIPSEKISHKKLISIAKIQTHKWSEYEMNLEKTLECCKSMKI